MYRIERDYTLPEPSVNDFGVEWPIGTNGQEVDQISKDLLGFRLADGENIREGFLTKYEHGLRLIQMLFPERVKLYRIVKHWKTGKSTVVWNHFFLDCFRDCCEHNRVCFAGSASSGKTFATAVYCLLSFMCNPMNTMIMISTTAGSDSERRIWGELKELHREANARFKLGTLIDYLKAITFDPSREVDEKSKSAESRDLRNGIIVIPIPKGNEGEKALGKIIGTKNAVVIWVIDELPEMMDGVLRPESNLESNVKYQFIGLGNSGRPTDPHGKLCEPDDGYDSISVDHDHWWAGDCFVRFLHGGRSPNFHPAIDPNITRKEDYPFPYLSNKVFMENVAYRNGTGRTREDRIETGKRTVDYMRFAVGFWYGADIPVTVMSKELVTMNNAHVDHAYFDQGGTTGVAGFDPAFTANGDSNEISFCKFGNSMNGEQILLTEPETVTIRTTVQDRVAFRTEIATAVINECEKRDVDPERLFMDISGDGGLMALEISRVWSEKKGRHVAPTGISSLEKTGDEDAAWHDIVTKLWFQAVMAIGTGRIRGFNLMSGYAKDLFERQYESVGKGIVKIESKSSKAGGKRGMKARIGRSPDKGDSWVYMIEGAKRSGFDIRNKPIGSSLDSKETIQDIIDRVHGRQSTEGSDTLTFDEAAELEEMLVF